MMAREFAQNLCCREPPSGQDPRIPTGSGEAMAEMDFWACLFRKSTVEWAVVFLTMWSSRGKLLRRCRCWCHYECEQFPLRLGQFGSSERKSRSRNIAPMAREKKLGCYALTEPNAGSDAAAQRTKCEKS